MFRTRRAPRGGRGVPGEDRWRASRAWTSTTEPRSGRAVFEAGYNAGYEAGLRSDLGPDTGDSPPDVIEPPGGSGGTTGQGQDEASRVSGSVTALEVVTISSPVSPGMIASLTARTQAGAHCDIAYQTPAGTHSRARGLVPATADATGSVSWSWMIGTATRSGTGTVRVTCDGASQTVSIVIR